MADFNENGNGVFGGVQFGENLNQCENVDNNNAQNEGPTNDVFGNVSFDNNHQGFGESNAVNFQPIEKDKAVTERGLWSRIKAFLFQEIDLYAPIKVELTPYQQKVEKEINDFLHQEVTFKGIVNFFKGKK